MIIIIQISLYFRPLTIRSIAKMWIFQLTSTSAHKSLLATLFLMTPFSLFNFPAKSAAIYLCVTTFPTWLSPAASLFPRETTIFKKQLRKTSPSHFSFLGKHSRTPRTQVQGSSLFGHLIECVVSEATPFCLLAPICGTCGNLRAGWTWTKVKTWNPSLDCHVYDRMWFIFKRCCIDIL